MRKDILSFWWKNPAKIVAVEKRRTPITDGCSH